MPLRMKSSEIHLPVEKKGEPDFKFMADFIDSLDGRGHHRGAGYSNYTFAEARQRSHVGTVVRRRPIPPRGG